MNKYGGFALIGVLLLTGCATTPQPNTESKSAASAEKEAPAEAAPIVPDEAPAEAEASADDEAYLAEVRLRVKGMDSVTDEQLVTASSQACDAYAAGLTKETIDIIQGDAPGEPMPGWNDLVIATWSATVYCPEFSS